MSEIPKLPKRDKFGHKGTFGSLGLIGGHANDHSVMFGGLTFASKAALASGIGLSKLVMPQEILAKGIVLSPQSTGLVLPKSSNQLNRIVAELDAAVFGIGLSSDLHYLNYLESLLKSKIPLVIDADAITLLAEKPSLAEFVHEDCVVTPHPKEYERLALSFNLQPVHVNSSNNLPAVKLLSDTLGCTVVIKDAETVVAFGGQSWQYDQTNPALATGGTGDVLSGIIGGLMAQFIKNDQLNGYDCARLAVTIHAEAAKAWSDENGDAGLEINKMISYIPKLVSKHRLS